MAHGDEEDAIPAGIEPRGLEVELQPTHRVERQIAKVGAAGGDEVLLLGRQRQHRRLAELAQMRQRAAEAPRCAAENGGHQRASGVGAHEEPQRSRAVQLAEGDAGPALAFGGEVASEVDQIVEAVEQDPGTKAVVLSHERAGRGHAAPRHRASVRLGPHRDNAGRVVPAPEPFVFAGRCGHWERGSGLRTQGSGLRAQEGKHTDCGFDEAP